MKRSVLYLFSIGAALALTACGKGDPEAVLLQAEAYVAEGNYDDALKFCNSLADTTKTHLTPSQLCRTAIIYGRISEQNDNPREMVSATECLQRATAINADSVTAFLNSATVDDKAMLYLIRNVNRAIIDPSEIIEEPSDEYLHSDQEVDFEEEVVVDIQ